MKVTKVLFKKRYSGEYDWLKISDIPQEFLVPENLIMIDVERGENDSNGWNEGSTKIRIAVEREQTQEEKDEFKKFLDKKRAEDKEKRRLEYLDLKKEFENEL